MSKIKLLLDVIEDVRSVADSLIPVVEKFKNLAESLQAVADAFASEEPKTLNASSPKADTDTGKTVVTYDELSKTLMDITRISKEHGTKLRALVRKYGATKLSEVSPEHYEAILAAAEVIRNAE